MKDYLLKVCLFSKVEAKLWISLSKFFTFLLLLCSSSAFAQTTVTGTVVDSETIPLPGVSVIIKGTSNGTITDFDGKYSLQTNPTDILLYTFIGYKPFEINVGSQTDIKVVLEVETTDLNEVVIVGYGVKKKSLITGAISSVDAEALKTTSTSRADMAIQGKTAGVMVMPTSGAPGANSKIRIRGTSSNGNSNPLFIVDGMKTSDINNIAPGDIANIEILKDAASAAIYGTEGSNGVVLITTKSGKKGTSKISYDFQYGVQSSRTKMELMDADQYRQWQSEVLDDDGIPEIGVVDDINNANTNWVKEGFQVAPMQKHRVSFSGGSEKTTYYISSSYLSQDGIVGGAKANYNRYTFRANVKSNVKSWLEVGSNLSYNHQKKRNVAEDDEYRGLVASMLLLDPLTPTTYNGVPDNITGYINDGHVPVRNESGKYFGVSQNVKGEISNPLAALETFNDYTEQDKLLGTAYAKISPIKGLSFTSRIGLDLTYENKHYWLGKNYLNANMLNSTATVDNTINKYSKWVWENFASYTKSVKDHSLTALVGYSAERYVAPEYTMHSEPLIAEDEDFAHQGYATSNDYDRIGGEFKRNSMASFFGRLSYDYKGKYMLEASIRRDGASQFPTAKKYGVFPAFSAGWVVSNEDFFNVPHLDYLKVRGSWGSNGSRANLPGNEDIALMRFNVRYPNAGGVYYPGAVTNVLPNPALLWESTVMTDIGLDMRFFDSKLSFAFDYYQKVTNDLITLKSGALSFGADFPYANTGDVTNSGIDLELGYRNRDNVFKYGINLNMSFVKNEVTRLNDAPVASENDVRGENIAWFEKGQPIWYFQGYETNGIHQEDITISEQDWKAGDPIVVDTNGDGIITAADKTFIGSPHPDMLFGGSIFAEYKGFDFMMSFQGSRGNDIFMGWLRTDLGASNKPAFMFEDRWTPENIGASMPRPFNSNPHVYNSDLMVQDGSYLRIKQMQVGYTLPTNLIQKVGFKSLRAYLSLDNYFTFTKYKGLDPEAGSSNDDSQGIDRGAYPAAGVVTFGLSLSL